MESSESFHRWQRLRNPPMYALVAVWSLALLLAGAALLRAVTQYQPPGPFDESRLGFCDFHNGIYFPSKAWLQGDIPYSQDYADKYPVMRQIPLFSPLVFIAHVPIAQMSLHLAEGVYFALMLVMIFACARLTVASLEKEAIFHGPMPSKSRWLFVGILVVAILFSRAAQTTLLNGYFTFELTVVTLLIFYFDDKRSWIASLALAYSSIKPTFAIPLGVLLLAMGRFPVVVRGTTLAIIGAVVGILWMAVNVPADNLHGNSNGLISQVGVVVDSMLNSQEVHRDSNWSRPAVSWTRIDLYSLYAKWTRTDPDDMAHLLVMIVLLSPVVWLLWKTRRRQQHPGLLGLSTAVAILSVSVSLYKHVYDAIPLLVVAVGAAVSTSPGWSTIPPRVRGLIAVLALIPLYNYTSARVVLTRLPQSQWITDLLTSVNAIVVCVTWLILLFYLLKSSKADTQLRPADPPEIG